MPMNLTAYCLASWTAYSSVTKCFEFEAHVYVCKHMEPLLVL